MNPEKFNNIRKEYHKGSLFDSDMPEDPMLLFAAWLEEAIQSSDPEPTAMVLSTVSDEGRPGSRVVLLKQADARGLVFYSNYLSRKGRELERNPHASLVFYWKELERQLRVEGKVSRLSKEEADEYFATRPRESQAGAVVSPQSSTIESRDMLEEAYRNLLKESEGKEIRRPEHWGGYVLTPDRIEFWQGRQNRLHDRILYTLSGTSWRKMRLAP